MSQKILISTDIGTDIDDALAVLLAQRSGLKVDGIYVTNGDTISRAKIAKKLLIKLDAEIEVGLGAANPISNKVSPYHMPFEGTFLNKKETAKSVKGWGIMEDGLSDLESKILQGRHVVVSLAPLTNIALLLNRNPELAKKIEKICKSVISPYNINTIAIRICYNAGKSVIMACN